MVGPSAKTIMAAAAAITVGVVFVAWTAVAENTPSEATPDGVGITANGALCNTAGGAWRTHAKTRAAATATAVAATTTA